MITVQSFKGECNLIISDKKLIQLCDSCHINNGNRKRNGKYYLILALMATLRDRPFNLKGGYGFLFRSEFFFRTTQELEYFFSMSRNFFQNLTLSYMTKTLNQIIFFFSTKIRIFFSATLGIRIFF